MGKIEHAYDYSIYVSGFSNHRFVARFLVFYSLLGLFTLFSFLCPTIFYFGVPPYEWPPIFFYSIGLLMLIFETPFFVKNLKTSLYESNDIMGHLDDESLDIFPSSFNHAFHLAMAEIKGATIEQSPFEKRHHYGTLIIMTNDEIKHPIRYVMDPEIYLSCFKK